MEKKGFYNKTNEFLAKNFVLVLFCLFLFFSIIYQRNTSFEPRIKTNYGRVGGNLTTRNYSKSVMTDSISYEITEESIDNGAVYMKTAGVNQQNSQNNRKIVKNFNLTLVVSDVITTKNNIENELEKYKGYTSNFYSYEYSNKKAISMELKIPSEKVDNYLNFVKKNGYIKSESFSSVDYTEQYNDNENKLKNLYSRRDKLRDMMKIQAKQLVDLLAVDKELNNTQIEIERLEKRNNKIQKDVDFSSVSITIEPEIIENKDNKYWSIKKVFINALNLLVLFCHTVVEYAIFVVVFLPVIILTIFIFYISKKIYKHLKNRKN